MSSVKRVVSVSFELHNLDLPHPLRDAVQSSAISVQSHLIHPLRDAQHAVHLAERLAEQPALVVSGVRVGIALLRVKRRLCMQ
jgi:hypothetical protein